MCFDVIGTQQLKALRLKSSGLASDAAIKPKTFLMQQVMAV